MEHACKAMMGLGAFKKGRESCGHGELYENCSIMHSKRLLEFSSGIEKRKKIRMGELPRLL